MNESDLLMLNLEIYEVGWGVVQTWIGITTAVVGAAHFAAARLNVFLTTGMISLYLLFSAACHFMMGPLGRRIGAAREDLVALQNAGVELSQSSLVVIEALNRGLVRHTLPWVFLAVALASCLYVIYCYRKRGA
jgi:hypothetical protein